MANPLKDGKSTVVKTYTRREVESVEFQSSTKPRVLIVAHAFPPLAGSHTTRMVYWVKYLSELGWDVAVVTPEPPRGTPLVDNGLSGKIPESVKVFRTPGGFLHRVFYRLKPGRSVASVEAPGPPSVGTKLSSWVVKKVRGLMIPDTIVEWLPYGIAFGSKAVRQFRPDVILSSAVPYTAHLIGLRLSQKFKLPWIVDYGDPWVYDPGNPRTGLRFFVESRMEKAVLNQATFVTVTTSQTQRDYIDRYSLEQGKVRVLSMGYDSEDFTEPIYDDSGHFTLVYTGRLEPENRNPQAFLMGVSELLKHRKDIQGKLSVRFIGHFDAALTESIRTLNLEGIVKVNGWVPHRMCMGLLAGADLLLLFGNAGTLQIPGKVFNYIGARRPVFMVLNGNAEEVDPTAAIIKQVPGSVVLNNDPSEVWVALARLFDKWQLGGMKRICVGGHSEIMNTFSWKASATELSEILTMATGWQWGRR